MFAASAQNVVESNKVNVSRLWWCEDGELSGETEEKKQGRWNKGAENDRVEEAEVKNKSSWIKWEQCE